MKKTDAIIVIFTAVLALAVCAAVRFPGKKGTVVAVYKDAELYGEYSASEKRTVELDGNTIVIEDGYAYMAAADCPDKLCIKQGKISDSAASIICLPNRVEVKMSGTGKADAVSR